MRHGIGMIHQHFMLVPTLTVTENVALGLPSSRKVLLDLDVVARRIKELAGLYHLALRWIAVIFEGEIMGVVDRADATVENLGLMMGGKRLEGMTAGEPRRLAKVANLRPLEKKM